MYGLKYSSDNPIVATDEPTQPASIGLGFPIVEEPYYKP